MAEQIKVYKLDESPDANIGNKPVEGNVTLPNFNSM